MLIKKYIAAISDTDILIHLTKAKQLKILDYLFEVVYFPEYIYKKELRNKAGSEYFEIDRLINDPNSIYKIVTDYEMDLTQKQIKRITLNEIGDLVGRGEAECAALSKAKDIPIIISDNSTEFKFLSEFLMLTYFDLLTLCVYHKVMHIKEATDIYNAINSILNHKSSDSFEVKRGRTMKRIEDNKWERILL